MGECFGSYELKLIELQSSRYLFQKKKYKKRTVDSRLHLPTDPNLVIVLPKKMVDPSNLDLVVLEESNLEPLLDLLGGLRFPTLWA